MYKYLQFIVRITQIVNFLFVLNMIIMLVWSRYYFLFFSNCLSALGRLSIWLHLLSTKITTLRIKSLHMQTFLYDPASPTMTSLNNLNYLRPPGHVVDRVAKLVDSCYSHALFHQSLSHGLLIGSVVTCLVQVLRHCNEITLDQEPAAYQNSVLTRPNNQTVAVLIRMVWYTDLLVTNPRLAALHWLVDTSHEAI